MVRWGGVRDAVFLGLFEFCEGIGFSGARCPGAQGGRAAIRAATLIRPRRSVSNWASRQNEPSGACA